MSNKDFECSRCHKRCGNAGASKTHIKTHDKPEPKSRLMLKWLVKRVKSEIKPKPKMAIELKPILKTGNSNFESRPFANLLLFQIPCAHDRPADLVSRSNRQLIPALLLTAISDCSRPALRIIKIRFSCLGQNNLSRSQPGVPGSEPETLSTMVSTAR